MKTLIVGAGALGGLIAARLIAAGKSVTLATRDERSAALLHENGLTVRGVGEAARVRLTQCAPLHTIPRNAQFDLVLLATKAPQAIELAPSLIGLLAPDGALLPIQNGGVAQIIRESTRDERVIGGLSNLGATMHAPGDYEQRNAGHLLIGELGGGLSPRIETIAGWLRAGVEMRSTDNFPGAVWSKLLLNCAVTTLGAIAGCTMREYLRHPAGRTLFDATYDEALRVARRSGVTPAKMLVDPIPPVGNRDAWVAGIVNAYGDLKPSMLQDFERGRPTEVDFINGYVADVARNHATPAPLNTAITAMVHSITSGERRPSLDTFAELRTGNRSAAFGEHTAR